MLRITRCERCHRPLASGVEFCDDCLAMVKGMTEELRVAEEKLDADGDQEALLPVLKKLTALLEECGVSSGGR